MAVTGLAKKLLIKPGQRMAILNAPAGYEEFLGELPEGAEVMPEPVGPLDWLFLFVQNSAELSQWSNTAIDLVKHDGLLWIAYPKGGTKAKTDLNRDILWKLMERTGLSPVALVAVDDKWSAMRLRPAELVGKR